MPHKRTLLLLLLVICMLTTIISISPAYATSDKNQPWRDWIDPQTHSPYRSVPEGINRTLVSWAWDIFGTGTAELAYRMLNIDPTQKIGSDADGDVTIQSIYLNILNSISGIGLALMCVYAALDLMDKAQSEMLTIDHFIRLGIKLIVGVIIMTNLPALINGALSFGNSLMNEVVSSNGNEGTMNFTLWYNRCKSGNFFAQIGNLLALLIPWLLSYLSIIVIFFICFARFIEFHVRAALAPIGMASIVSQGFSGPGGRYFKKLVAIALQGVVIVTILRISNTVKGYIDNISPLNALTGFIGILVISIVTVALVLKAQSWANDLVGV